ncbi:MAG: type IV secretion system protein [Gemmatimonadetes bacterium]|nr:type IV secretion system protein [Gemmatimonadota bacterium]
MTTIENLVTPDVATAPDRARRARPLWPSGLRSRVAGLAAAFSAAAAALAPAQQIDPNVPTVIPEDELTNTIGILDRVLVDLLTPGTPPMLDAGMDLWRGLAIVLVVWTGLRIAYGGAGWRAWDLVQLVLTLWIPWLLLSTYDTDIPGIGMPFPMILPRGANEIAAYFAGNTIATMTEELTNLGHQVSLQVTTAWNELSLWELVNAGHSLLVTLVAGVVLSALFFLLFLVIFGIGVAQVLFAKVAIAIFIFLGPVMIPFYVFQPLQFLFWGWFKGLLTFSLYSVIAACLLRVWSGIAVGYITSMTNFSFDYSTIGTHLLWSIAIIPLCIAAVLSTLKVGDIATALVTGGGAGGSGAMGLAGAGTMMIRSATIAASPVKGA